MRYLTSVFFAVLLLANPRSVRAQQISPSTPPPPPPEETPPAEKPPAPAQPVFDPLHAEKSIEIGTFYLKKGNYDAAIDRFMDATHFQPMLARPWRLLGEAYDKKHDDGRAIESYKKYLEILPGAEDAVKVRKHIAALEERAGQEASRRASH
jgi:tetratricopeptide (TPR) repeat protein